MESDHQGEPSLSGAFSDARPGINFTIGWSGVGIGILCSLLGTIPVNIIFLHIGSDAETAIFYGLVLGYATGAGPGVILGGRLQRVTGRWWGAILGSLLGMAISFQLQAWFQEDFLMFAYFILPTVLAVAGYQPIRPRVAEDQWN